MKRHPFNLFSLLFGTFLVLLAAWTTWLTFPVRGWVIDFSRWLLPTAAILVGAALLSPLFTPKQAKRTSGDETEEEASGLEAETSADRS